MSADPTGKVIPTDSLAAGGWPTGGVNTGLRGKHLLNMLAKKTAELEALRVVINQQDEELKRRAIRLHDHHGEALDRLRPEFATMEPDAEPALGDAYAHRLLDRHHADDLMSILDHQNKNFRSKTDPESYRNPRAVPPGFHAQEDEGPEDEEKE